MRHQILFVLALLPLLTRCASKKLMETPSPPVAAPVSANAVTPETASAPKETSRAVAEKFDQWLFGKVGEEEYKKLREECEQSKQPHVFCYSYTHPELFEAKPRKPRNRVRGMGIRPQFANGKVTNWSQLRFGSTSELVRGTSRLSLMQLLALKKLGLEETLCPNNIAVAIAVGLENYLGEEADSLEVAQLYEKGADCLVEPKQKENLLTRAGLFYFMNHDYLRAATLFRQVALQDESTSARAHYWLYRSQLELKEVEAAKATAKKLNEKFPFSFHSLVVRLREQDDPSADWFAREAAMSKKRSDQQSPINPLIEQMEVLKSFGLDRAASRVIDIAIASSDAAEPEVKIYLAELKDEKEEYSGNIGLLSNVLADNPHLISKKTLELYFPKAYFPVFEKHAGQMDPYLFLAIARQESAFNPNAISRANARGLLQILPSTRKRLFPRQPTSLLDPDVNAQVGIRYFTELVALLNGQIHLALAAYNAGPHRVQSWLKKYPSDEPLLFIDLIPYRETRNYVSSILRNYFWYRRVHTDTKDFDWWLKDISPRIPAQAETPPATN